MSEKLCSVKDCNNPHEAKGLCSMHYQRARARGTTSLAPSRARYSTPEEAFDARTKRVGECLVWTGAKRSARAKAGHLSVNGKNVPVHRWIWERAYGPLQPDQRLTRTCGTDFCVAPHHHKITTRSESMAKRKDVGKHNGTGVKYVSRTPSGKFFVQINRRGHRHYFGVFDNLDEAAKVAKEADHFLETGE